MNAQTEVKAQHSSIATALAAAQMEMGKALKSANNPHFKSKYADLSSVTDACLPALNKNGIAVIQPMGEDEHGRYVETVLIHGESGERLSCRVPLIVQKNDMQGYGSACTYARRYGLMAMAGIAPEDDDGNAAVKAAPKREAKEPAPDVEACISYIKTLPIWITSSRRGATCPPMQRRSPQSFRPKTPARLNWSTPILAATR